MQVAADHVGPVGTVARVAVGAVQAHHVRQVGERGRSVLLLRAGTRDAVRRLAAERCGAIEVLDEVWQQAQDVQGET